MQQQNSRKEQELKKWYGSETFCDDFEKFVWFCVFVEFIETKVPRKDWNPQVEKGGRGRDGDLFYTFYCQTEKESKLCVLG